MCRGAWIGGLYCTKNWSQIFTFLSWKKPDLERKPEVHGERIQIPEPVPDAYPRLAQYPELLGGYETHGRRDLVLVLHLERVLEGPVESRVGNEVIPVEINAHVGLVSLVRKPERVLHVHTVFEEREGLLDALLEVRIPRPRNPVPQAERELLPEHLVEAHHSERVHEHERIVDAQPVRGRAVVDLPREPGVDERLYVPVFHRLPLKLHAGDHAHHVLVHFHPAPVGKRFPEPEPPVEHGRIEHELELLVPEEIVEGIREGKAIHLHVE